MRPTSVVLLLLAVVASWGQTKVGNDVLGESLADFRNIHGVTPAACAKPSADIKQVCKDIARGPMSFRGTRLHSDPDGFLTVPMPSGFAARFIHDRLASIGYLGRPLSAETLSQLRAVYGDPTHACEQATYANGFGAPAGESISCAWCLGDGSTIYYRLQSNNPGLNETVILRSAETTATDGYGPDNPLGPTPPPSPNPFVGHNQ